MKIGGVVMCAHIEMTIASAATQLFAKETANGAVAKIAPAVV